MKKCAIVFAVSALTLSGMVFDQAMAQSQDTCTTVFDFDGPNAIEDWDTTNDNVMGGRSTGGPAISDGVLTFSGATNTDGGGFSSISAPVERRSLDGITSFRMRYLGNGRPFKFSLETGETRYIFFRIQYWQEFQTAQSDEWQEIDLPVSDFQATYRGEPIEGRTLNPRRIRDLGFFIYDEKDGDFELQVDWIKACR